MVMSSSGDHYDEDWLEELYQPTDTPPATAEFPVTTSPTTPKSSLSKPIRRRSRSSKKTPTTILNANANNFRSLVQQFTGRPKSSAAAFPLGAHRGPVNLNFSNYREQDYNTAVAGASQYSDEANYIGLAASGSSLNFPDHRTVTLPQNNSYYDDQGLGTSVISMTSSFNNGYSTASNFDGGFVLTGGSSVAMAPQDQEFDHQFAVEELGDMARVSEGLSYTSSRDYWQLI